MKRLKRSYRSALASLANIRRELLQAFHEPVTWSRFRKVVIDAGLALLVGGVAGLGAVGFRLMISGIHTLFFEGGGGVFGFLGHYYVIIIPAIGGLLVGPLVFFFARETRGAGVPEVMLAVARRGGRIRPIVSLVKALASSITIGSGGSAGREGPIVQIGASFGSTIGQWLKLEDNRIITLVACGAAGGIAATFNAPIAGALFALEIILRRVVTPIFVYVFLSAVTADYVAHVFLGNRTLFVVPSFQLVSPIEIVVYGVVGVIAAVAAVLLVRGIYGCEHLFERVRTPDYLKPALGGLAVGLIGLYSVDLLGLGYGEIQALLTGEFAIGFLLAMAVLKIAATSLTLGSGGSGGVFSPSLFVGAIIGTLVASAFRGVLPVAIGPTGAYGVVAMAAVFAAAARAPFTAVIVVIEMTGAYGMVLPLMAAVSIATALSTVLTRGTIYTTKLLRAGIDIDQTESP